MRNPINCTNAIHNSPFISEKNSFRIDSHIHLKLHPIHSTRATGSFTRKANRTCDSWLSTRRAHTLDMCGIVHTRIHLCPHVICMPIPTIISAIMKQTIKLEKNQTLKHTVITSFYIFVCLFFSSLSISTRLKCCSRNAREINCARSPAKSDTRFYTLRSAVAIVQLIDKFYV